jgi:predicted nuclease of predicted toxin-antitoxin system
MPIPLYMDVHVPILITESLRRRGLDVLTSQDDGTAAHDDELLLERAFDLGRVLFTQDQDFLRIEADWQCQGRSPVSSLPPSREPASAAWPMTWNSC